MIWTRLKDAWFVLRYGQDARLQRIQLDAFQRGRQYGRREADLRYRPLIAELEHSTRKLNEMSRMLEPVTNLLNAFQKE